jgi:hypothetical protein
MPAPKACISLRRERTEQTRWGEQGAPVVPSTTELLVPRPEPLGKDPLECGNPPRCPSNLSRRFTFFHRPFLSGARSVTKASNKGRPLRGRGRQLPALGRNIESRPLSEPALIREEHCQFGWELSHSLVRHEATSFSKPLRGKPQRVRNVEILVNQYVVISLNSDEGR